MAGPPMVYSGGCTISLHFSYPESPSSSASDDAAQPAATAVQRARDQLHRVALSVQRTLQASPQYAQAMRDTQQAYLDYALARQASLEAAHASPEMMTMKIEIEHLEQRLTAARDQARLDGKDQTADVCSLSWALLAQRAKFSRWETDALKADETVQKLYFAFLDANLKVLSIQQDLTQQFTANSEWRSAKAQLEQTQTALASISR
jgi:hypothetical protein